MVVSRYWRFASRGWCAVAVLAAVLAASCVAQEPYQPRTSAGGGSAGTRANAAGKAGLELVEPTEGGAGSAATSGGATSGGPEPECLTSEECALPYPYCSPTTQRCVECLSQRNCSGSGRAYCEPKSNVCVSCLTDAQCPHTEPYCATTLGLCVSCLSSDNCGGGGRACDRTSFRCVPTCGTHADCAGTAETQYCDPERNLCVACIADDGCTSDATPRCALDGKKCVQCLGNADCASPTPLCDTKTHGCAECLSSADCSPGVFCIAGTCADPK